MKELQVEGYHIDEVILRLHKEKVLECFDLLNDTESRETYAHIIMCRINGEYPQEQYVSPEQYSINNGLGSKITENSSAEGDECRIVAIDEFIKEPFTYLKADIESYEYKLLAGARHSIAKYRPLLAVYIYHNAADLYDIPLLIKSIIPEYKIQIRHHSDFLDDTVLYAWID